MLLAYTILLLMAVFLFILAFLRKDSSHIQGLKNGLAILKRTLPLLLLAFILTGLIEVVIPSEIIKTWLGDEAGLTGILIGSFSGALILGGPYVSFPVFATVFKAGAGVGTTVSLITGWAMFGLGQLLFESALIGYRFMLVRLSLVLITPIIAGIIAHLLFV